MSRSQRTLFLACVAALQLAVLSGELVRAAWPRWFGEPVTLRVRPVDPRSPFRGDYARLAYEDVSRVDWELFPDDVTQVRRGQLVWLILDEQDGHHVPRAARLTRPSSGLLLRGRATSNATRGRYGVPVDAGIGAFFASPERAKELERRMRAGEKASALVRVLPGGRASLVDITFQPREAAAATPRGRAGAAAP